MLPVLFKSSVLGLAVACALTACSSSGEGPRRSMIGAGLDALSGFVGRGREERNEALKGSGTQAVGSSEANSYMDQEEAALRAALKDDATVARAGTRIIVNVPSTTLFDANSEDVRRRGRPVLDRVGAVLKSFDRTTIDVYGHTDDGGDEKKNLDLTQRRALAVATYLAGKGVNEQRLSVTGFGAARPVGSNDTAEGKQKNRRIEIQLSPVT